jgi:hypothetical protein
MSVETYKYWPFNVLPPERRTEFHAALIALLEAAHAAGYAPYVNDTESLIGFGDPGRRAVEYVHRGGHNRYWEPWLTDRGNGIRLGPQFGFSDSKCIVFDGIADVATFTMRWLSGLSLEDSLDGIPVYDRMNTSTKLKVNS